MLPPPDNAMPTKRGRYGFPALLLLALAVLAAPYWYFALVQKQIAKKDEEIKLLTKSVGDLRADNQAQEASNSANRVMLEPFRKIALELHPEMGPDPAVFKLADDLARLPMLPSNRIFRPLNQTSRSNLVSSLKDFQNIHRRVRVELRIEEISKNQNLLAEELLAIFKEGGMDASITNLRTTGMDSPPFGNALSAGSDNGYFMREFVTILRKGTGMIFADTTANTSVPNGRFIIKFHGDPLFLPDGTVVLRGY
jgi:hypothetical protein